MTISKKFVISFVLSILFITTINIISFSIFYSAYLKIYLVEKNQSKIAITLEYINEVLEKQTIDDIDSIFILGDLGTLENRKIESKDKQANILIKKEFWEQLKSKKNSIFKILNTNIKSNFQQIIEKRKDEKLSN